ncbi:hypothetical protein OAF54_01875 [bacterium]|nr:hypothetical protein [bacterium]
MKSYNYLQPEDINRETLVANDEFLADAANYLYKSTEGDIDLTEPEEIYDEFSKRMRYHDVNEVDTVSDLLYAQEADEESKAEMARLFDVYDKSEISTEDLGEKIVDYGYGIASAPSTWIGLLTGGTGKAVSVAGQQATKEIVRRTLKGALKAGLVEGAIGAGQSVAQQGTRMELDPEREFSGTEVALTAGLSALPGVALGGVNALRLGAKEADATLLKQQGEAAFAKRDAEAKVQARETIEKAKSADSKSVSEVEETLAELEALTIDPETGKAVRLKPLDPELVKEGKSLQVEALEDSGIDLPEGFEVRLEQGDIDKMTAAILEMKEIIPRNPGNRITADLSLAIANGDIPLDMYVKTMEKYNLTQSQIALIYQANVSQAARLLRAQQTIAGKSATDILLLKKQLQEAVKNGAKATEVTGADLNLANAVGQEAVVRGTARDLGNKFERVRRSIMTSQPVTTLRNVFGGASRLTLDMFEEAVETSGLYLYNGLAKRVGFKQAEAKRSFLNSADVGKYIVNTPEADLIVNLFKNRDAEGFDRFFGNFIDSAVAGTKAGGQPEGAVSKMLTNVGNGLNILNRMSDNFFKKATFAGELSRLVKANYGENLSDLIREGRFNEINPKLFNEAMDKSLEMVYQKTPKGEGFFARQSRNYLEVDKQYGFLTGLLIPFPRFVINQIQFMYEHAPVLGLIQAEKLGGGEKVAGRTLAKRISQQVSGAGMLGMFYALRDTQDPGTLWHNVETEDGTLDLRPMVGPMNLELYIADFIHKLRKGQPTPDLVGITQDMVQTAIGSPMRAGTGLQLVNELLPNMLAELDSEGASGGKFSLAFEQKVGKVAGDYLNTFTFPLPISVARDLYSLTDEQLRLIPETGGEVDWWDIASARAGRSLGPIRGMLYEDNKEDPRYSILRSTPGKKVDPLRTATTGFNISENANEVEKEANRLQVRPYQIYRRIKFGPADVRVREKLAGVLPEKLSSLIRSKEYQELTTDENKRKFFREKARDTVKEITSGVLNELGTQIELYQKENPNATEEMIEEKFGYTSNTLMQQKYETEISAEDRAAVESEIGPPQEDSSFLEYYKRGKAKATQELASGGMVQSFDEGGAVVGKTRAGQPIYDSGVDDQTKQMVELGLDIAPVTGEIRSAQAAVEDFEKGDYGMAALGALGALPGVGMAGRAAKAGVKTISKYADDLWDVPTQKITSADTSINSSKLPAGYSKLKDMDVFKPGQRVVDIGGGRFDNAVDDLAKKDVELQVYDPFNRAPEHNQAVKELVADGGADIAVSNNVLNVIEEPENIRRVVQQAENAVKPGDKAYFTIYQGDGKGVGRITKEKKNKDGTVEPKSYQRNEKTDAYVPRVEEVFGKGNVERKGDVIIATKNVDTPPPATKVDAPKERTFKNEKGTTFKRGNKKYPVGKVVGNQVYFHKNYLDDMPKEAQDLYYKALEKLPADHNFNTLMYEPASKGKPARIRFDESADFDIAREPTPGKYISIDDAGNLKSGKTDQVFHHKWMWVDDAYEGFDVDNSYNWSKQWAQTLNKAPSGYKNKWEQELKEAGLPLEDAAKKYSPSDLGMSRK